MSNETEQLAQWLEERGKTRCPGEAFIWEWDADKATEAADTLRRLRALVEGYEGVLEDKVRLTRELDVAMHGEEGAAKQASLCDLIEPAKRMRETIERLRTLPHAEDCGYWHCGTCAQPRFNYEHFGHNWHPGKCNCPLSEVE